LTDRTMALNHSRPTLRVKKGGRKEEERSKKGERKRRVGISNSTQHKVHSTHSMNECALPSVPSVHSLLSIPAQVVTSIYRFIYLHRLSTRVVTLVLTHSCMNRLSRYVSEAFITAPPCFSL
jgi:hypothetical protein